MAKNKSLMAIKAILILILSLCCQSSILAEEKINFEDKIIGSTFKALAKGFVATVDINKLKNDNIDKLNKMDEDKFKRRYANVYETIKDLPPHLKVNYEITENMSKEQVIEYIKSLDKKKMNEIIDSTPDIFIAGQFKQYLDKKKQEIQENNVLQQVNALWSKMIRKTDVSNPQKSLP